MLVDVPLEAVSKLAERDDVLYVEPRFAGEEPPQNTNANDDVDDGRARIVSDPYFNLGQTGGWIGLLDTGLRFTHTQCNAPSHIDFRRDRVNGGADCNTGTGLNPNDDCWNHGTSSAAIITANANQGNPFRGVTGVTLHSFKVYPSRRRRRAPATATRGSGTLGAGCRELRSRGNARRCCGPVHPPWGRPIAQTAGTGRRSSTSTRSTENPPSRNRSASSFPRSRARSGAEWRASQKR